MDIGVVSIAARLAQFGGAVVLFGAPLLMLTGFGPTGGPLALRLSWPRWAFPFAALLAIVGALASLTTETASMTGDASQALSPPALWTVLSGTQFGLGLTARLGLASLALGLGAWRPSAATHVALALVGGGVLASFAWTGHGAMDEGGAGLIHLSADLIHLWAAGAWLGALAVFTACLNARRVRDDAEGGQALHAALKRFSGVGSVCVALLLATGLVNSGFLIGLSHVGEMPRSPYGQVLIAKLVLFAAMVGLAGVNRFVLTPRLERDGGAFSALRWSVGLESLAALLVLGLVAWLGTLAPLNMS